MTGKMDSGKVCVCVSQYIRGEERHDQDETWEEIEQCLKMFGNEGEQLMQKSEAQVSLTHTINANNNKKTLT